MLGVGVESDRADEGVIDVNPVGELTPLRGDRRFDEGAGVRGSERPVDPCEPRAQALAVPINPFEDDECIRGGEEADGGTPAEGDALWWLRSPPDRSSMTP